MIAKKTILQYTMIVAFILIILSAIITNYNMKIITLFFLMSIILHWITNDIYKSIGISFFIMLFFYLTGSNSYEGFENKDGEINVDNLLKELTELAGNVNKDIKDDVEVKDDNENKKDSIGIDDLDLLSDDVPKEGGKYMEEANAQRETFRLINTIKQLDDTVKNLAPTLKQGADIIEKFKKLNLINN